MNAVMLDYDLYPRLKTDRKKIKQSGFNLIENLVTLSIISIGMLGIVGLLSRALTVNQNSYYYSAALILAEDMADRMRANLRGVADQRYNLADSQTSSVSENTSCLQTSACSSEEMAAHDIWEWQQKLAQMLPAGVGFICRDSSPSFDATDYIGQFSTSIPASCDNTGDNYAIHIGWDMGEEKDGEVEIKADVEKSDGHLIIAFSP